MANLPAPPAMGLRSWVALIGPGMMMAGVAIGAGEWLFGPAVASQYGGTILWLATISILCQLVVNLEVMRYALYCGEPVYVGFSADPARAEGLGGLVSSDGCQQYLALHGGHGRGASGRGPSGTPAGRRDRAVAGDLPLRGAAGQGSRIHCFSVGLSPPDFRRHNLPQHGTPDVPQGDRGAELPLHPVRLHRLLCQPARGGDRLLPVRSLAAAGRHHHRRTPFRAERVKRR